LFRARVRVARQASEDPDYASHETYWNEQGHVRWWWRILVSFLWEHVLGARASAYTHTRHPVTSALAQEFDSPSAGREWLVWRQALPVGFACSASAASVQLTPARPCAPFPRPHARAAGLIAIIILTVVPRVPRWVRQAKASSRAQLAKEAHGEHVERISSARGNEPARSYGMPYSSMLPGSAGVSFSRWIAQRKRKPLAHKS
jgi:hypothetical protein